MSADIVIEDVPRFIKRYGDHALEGSNNTLIVMGTDRAKKGKASIDDGLGNTKSKNGGKGTGSILIVSGRKDKDPDFDKDDSFIYISSKTNCDTNLGLDKVEKNADEKPSIIAKSDTIRLVYRNSIKIVLDGGKNYVYIDDGKVTINIDKNKIEMDSKKLTADVGNTKLKLDGTQIELKNGSNILNITSSLTKINSPKVHLTGGCEKPWSDLFDAVASHQHMTSVGPTTPPTLPTPLTKDKLLWTRSVTE